RPGRRARDGHDGGRPGRVRAPGVGAVTAPSARGPEAPSPAHAVALAASWAAALALLAGLCARTPLSGPGPMFVAWSVPASALTALSVRWLRRLGLAQVPVTRGGLVAIGVAWAAAAGTLLLTGQAAEIALDGLVLRRPLLRAGGLAIGW